MEHTQNKVHTQNIVRIHRPELSEQERQRRMENIRRAAAALVLAAEGSEA